MTELPSTDKKELKPDRRKILWALPHWSLWISWSMIVAGLLWTLGYATFDMLVMHNYFAAVIFVIMLVACYFLSTSLIAMPVTLTAGSKLLKRDYLELEKSHRRMLRFLKSIPVPKDTTFAALYVNIALGQMQRGLNEEAELNIREGLKYVNEKKKQHRPLAAIAYCNLGCSLFRQYKIQQSLDAYGHVLKIIESMPKFYLAYRIIAYTGLGIAHSRNEDYALAAENFEQCIELCTNDKCRAINKKSLPFVKFAAYSGLALSWARRGKLDASRENYKRMMECVGENVNCGDANCGYLLSELANSYMEAGDMHRAEAILQLAYNWCSKQPMHPESQLILFSYEALLKQTDRAGEIADMKRWLRLIPEKQLLLS